MIGVRSVVLGALLALAVTVAYQLIVGLVEASGARDQPALILILLLSAFLGVLAAVATRMLRLPGATAPTVLVLGWTLIPVILGAIPSAATSLFAGDAALSSGQALALATATGAITLANSPTQVADPEPATPGVITGLAANGIPNVALNAYRVAAARMASARPYCGIDWSLLAGIGRVESNHGRYGGAVLDSDGTASPDPRPTAPGASTACTASAT